MNNNISRTFRGKLSLALFASFLVVGIFTAVLMICSSRAYQREVVQIMHKDLAAHVAGHYLLFENGKPNLEQAKNTFHDLMILGPNFEFYILDTQGKILAFSAKPDKVKRKSVDLTPIRAFIDNKNLSKPLYGDDPKGYDREKIFSATPISAEGKTQGYLYVILGSEIYDRIADTALGSKMMQWGLWFFASGLVIALLVTLWVTGLITRPIENLSRCIGAIQRQGFSKNSEQNNSIIQQLNEVTNNSSGEVKTLGTAFTDALEKIQQQYQNIVTIDELRKELLSHVSHDLRTPLASLLGYLETWELNQDKLSTEQSRTYIATAKRNAQRISSLVEQLFELAHLDSGNVQVTRERFAIAELVQDVLQKFAIEAQKKNITLLVTPQDSSIKVTGDIEKLERVFTNLIENALRHTGDGGSITVRLNAGGGPVAIEVADTGLGIPDEDIPHIFEPHYKAGNSVRENTAHGGLGLAITKRLLELHQASIQVKSKINYGTSFTFTLQES